MQIHKYMVWVIFCSGIWWPSQDVNGQIITPESVMQQVMAHHPRSIQADLKTQVADAYVLKARGSFDPVISGSFDNKNFDDKEYFRSFFGEIKIPTWYGLDFKAGYESHTGDFVNPENSTPTGGLYYMGATLPLGRGLLIDNRRTRVREARIGQKIAQTDRTIIYNQLLFESVYAYWTWFLAYHNQKVFEDALLNAQERYEGIRKDVMAGDRAGIDTVEAAIQIQNIRINLNKVENELVMSLMELSNYFWDENQLNISLQTGSEPLDIETAVGESVTRDIQNAWENLIQNHPYLQNLILDNRQLEVQNRNLRDRLKPDVFLNYNPLTQATGNPALATSLLNNYKWGLGFYYPLFLRKERADIRINEFKMTENQLKIREQEVDIANDIKQQIAEWNATRDQVILNQEALRLYKNLLDAERRLFSQGESSLFLINTREQVYINAAVKLNETIVKNHIAFNKIFYYAGKMDNLLN